jgi:hypothetical protein
MDLAIALGQGAGLAVACGLLAGLPLFVAALAALIFGFAKLGEPGAARALDDVPVVTILGVIAVADLAVDLSLSERWQIALRAAAGAAVFALVFWHEVPFLGLLLGAAIAAFSALVGVRLAASAARAGDKVSATLLAAGGAFAAAVLSIIPFVGYVLLAAAIWFGLKTRRRDDERYAGLRVLR